MKVEIWSDVVCPFCYIGKRRFEDALQRFPESDDVEVRWRSFELDPSAPREQTGPLLDHLADKYGISRADAEAFQARMTEMAEGEGLTFHLDRARPGNTFDAHRLLKLAVDRDREEAVTERLMAAYLSEGEAIGDRDTLVRLAAEAGLDGDEAAGVLDSDAYADAVRADEAEARSLGIDGVPFFVLDRSFGVVGAQPSEKFADALQRAWANAHPLRARRKGLAPADDR